MRKAAKTVTSRPWGFPFFGRELYTDNTASDILSPHVFSGEGINGGGDLALESMSASDCEVENWKPKTAPDRSQNT